MYCVTFVVGKDLPAPHIILTAPGPPIPLVPLLIAPPLPILIANVLPGVTV